MKDFIDYLQSVWGKLSVSSIIFPFAGKLIGAFETPDPFATSSASILALTSIIGAFVILLLYVLRNDVNYSVLLAISIFIVGIVLSFNYMEQSLCWDVGCTLVYLAIFTCFTSSFTMLAIKDLYQ